MINNISEQQYNNSLRQGHLCWPGGLPVILAMDGGPCSPKIIFFMIRFLSSSEVDVLKQSCPGLEVGVAPANPVAVGHFRSKTSLLQKSD